MSYADCFIVPVPKAKLDEYTQLAKLACQVWMEHGALEYHDWIADNVPEGEVTSLPLAVKLQDDELVGFGYARYRSREHRDAVMEKVMADVRMQPHMTPEGIPFDGQRMIWGGFKPLVNSDAQD